MGVIIPRGVFQSIFPSVEKQERAQTRSLIKLLNVHILINHISHLGRLYLNITVAGN